MTVTINLPPDIEAGLLAQAEAEGVGVSDYLQNLVRSQIEAKLGANVAERPAYELPPEEWLREFRAWVASHADKTIVLPDEAMERESIYGDHGV